MPAVYCFNVKQKLQCYLLTRITFFFFLCRIELSQMCLGYFWTFSVGFALNCYIFLQTVAEFSKCPRYQLIVNDTLCLKDCAMLLVPSLIEKGTGIMLIFQQLMHLFLIESKQNHEINTSVTAKLVHTLNLDVRHFSVYFISTYHLVWSIKRHINLLWVK